MKRTLSDLITNSDTKDLVIKNVNIDSIKESPTQARNKLAQKKLEELNKDEYIFYNNLVLGNTRIANLFNFPAITIPVKKNYWLSFTILAKEKNDEGLLSIAKEIESILHT